jgi:hypothetical protein
MRIACWIFKATYTHTHSECVIPIVFPQQQWLHERASTLPYTYIAFLVNWTVDLPLTLNILHIPFQFSLFILVEEKCHYRLCPAAKCYFVL